MKFYWVEVEVTILLRCDTLSSPSCEAAKKRRRRSSNKCCKVSVLTVAINRLSFTESIFLGVGGRGLME